MQVDVDVIDRISPIIDRARNLRPAWDDAADLLEQQTAARFDRRGEGDWPPLDLDTLARRRRAGISSTRVLEVTGRLRRSLTGQSSDAVRQTRGDELVFGTRVPYAPHVARRRPPLPDLDRQLADRVGGILADHLFDR